MQTTIKNKYISLTVDNHGAEIRSIIKNGVEYIHQPNPQTWNRSAPYLFPNIGAIKDKQTFINGQPYPLPKHGFLRDCDLTLVDQSESKLTYQLNNSAETENFFPFKFELLIIYFLVDSSVSVRFLVRNLDEKILPFNLGLHPAFNVPLNSKEHFEDYRIEFTAGQDYQIPTVDLKTGLIDWKATIRRFQNLKTLPLNYHDYDNDALIFTNVPSRKVSLLNKNNSGVSIEFLDFPLLGIWTPNHVQADFICLEPWIGCGDSPTGTGNFAEKQNIIQIEKNNTWTTEFNITIH